MTGLDPLTKAEEPGAGHAAGAYRVRRPRVYDAIGKALRRAFGEGEAPPLDLVRVLSQLDRLPG